VKSAAATAAVALILSTGVAAATTLGGVGGAGPSGGNAAIGDCDLDGLTTSYVTSGGDITGVTVGGIADPGCEGGLLSLTVTDSTGAAVAAAPPQPIAADADGVDNIVGAQQRVARGYLTDGSLQACCPPRQALIHIMARGDDPATTAELAKSSLRVLFTRESLLSSDWYRRRLEVKQWRDAQLWARHVTYLEGFLARTSHREVAVELDAASKLEVARQRHAAAQQPAYLELIRGTPGADPLEDDSTARAPGR